MSLVNLISGGMNKGGACLFLYIPAQTVSSGLFARTKLQPRACRMSLSFILFHAKMEIQ